MSEYARARDQIRADSKKLKHRARFLRTRDQKSLPPPEPLFDDPDELALSCPGGVLTVEGGRFTAFFADPEKGVEEALEKAGLEVEEPVIGSLEVVFDPDNVEQARPILRALGLRAPRKPAEGSPAQKEQARKALAKGREALARKQERARARKRKG